MLFIDPNMNREYKFEIELKNGDQFAVNLETYKANEFLKDKARFKLKYLVFEYRERTTVTLDEM